MNRKQKRILCRILAAAVLLAAVHFVPATGIYRVLLFLLPYLTIGYDILWRAALNIAHGDIFDENFLMTIATVGAFFTGECSEGVAVMLFYQVGELFQSCAVARSRKSIAALMDICPQYANVETDGEIDTVPPEEVPVGAILLVKPGEKIPLDGVIEEGTSTLDTAAITGESMPRTVTEGETAVSGCINLTGVLRLRVTKPYAQSTVSQIVEMVENAPSRKARTEQFITKFARWYTPLVVLAAVLLAVIPSLVTGEWKTWIHRALIFLVISCPCALVISVPLTFFGGIGGASRRGVLVKGGNYLEVLSRAETVVFDKTGTLTEGVFRVTEVHPTEGEESELLALAAHAEAYSDHPIATSVRQAYGAAIDTSRIGEVTERAGYGVAAVVDGRQMLVGNARMLTEAGIPVSAVKLSRISDCITRAWSRPTLSQMVTASLSTVSAVEMLS
ncbi:MAG: cadmium-translocating P-type ATPase, partial [Clostridia bacterium]|nr:cadmium-translocating P-type ATPase [Clostridia bacterium]